MWQVPVYFMLLGLCCLSLLAFGAVLNILFGLLILSVRETITDFYRIFY